MYIFYFMYFVISFFFFDDLSFFFVFYYYNIYLKLSFVWWLLHCWILNCISFYYMLYCIFFLPFSAHFLFIKLTDCFLYILFSRLSTDQFWNIHALYHHLQDLVYFSLLLLFIIFLPTTNSKIAITSSHIFIFFFSSKSYIHPLPVHNIVNYDCFNVNSFFLLSVPICVLFQLSILCRFVLSFINYYFRSY